jgi:hypothetical protein
MVTLSPAVKATAPLQARQLDDVLAQEVASPSAQPAGSLANADRWYLLARVDDPRGDRGGDPLPASRAGRRMGPAHRWPAVMQMHC